MPDLFAGDTMPLLPFMLSIGGLAFIGAVARLLSGLFSRGR